MFLRTIALALIPFVITLAMSQAVGDATFYHPGLGSCGSNNFDGDFVVAVDQQTFDTFPGAGSNPNENPICDKQISISYQGRIATATIVDCCPDCDIGDLDLSPAVFNQLADPSAGRLHGVQWDYI